MAAEFDGLDYAGVKLNGQQILGENIVDAGGLSCALEAAKRSDQVDLVAFFNHLALIWRLKTTETFQQFMVNIDVHAPGSLRTNIQAQNIDDFYQTFHVTEQDQMWLAPDKRVQIW
ncbi:neutral endopeptidase [Lapidilactobacillus concavus DSM 17758]|uniref:Neutral endopeptidase n=2 Tax=Lapidilactobacillus TaxID=2767884 RepID=A0A0R1VRW2_9LACO|nr:neutral endopeptidase [Lapidilactobacillus concavus DSM 17758]GEL14078.1 hypothetical protein LCO01nite_16270 [Lapidilactobacillus concavus]